MEKECRERLNEIMVKFKQCRKALSALGDETRQLIILVLLEGDAGGVRVGEISKRIHLSRPSVSHHLQVLKEARIVNMRREGTRNFYFIDARESQWKTMSDLLQLINRGIQHTSGWYPNIGN